MSERNWSLILVLFTVALIMLGLTAMLAQRSTETTADTASEARQTLRDCTGQADHTATVKTIWAGTPPVPVRYEITCNKLRGK
jgi:hypothetical protein